MHWDVVELKAEPNHRLFVRFKDGLNGNVQLLQESLRGALEPLRDQASSNRFLSITAPSLGPVISIWLPIPCMKK